LQVATAPEDFELLAELFTMAHTFLCFAPDLLCKSPALPQLFGCALCTTRRREVSSVLRSVLRLVSSVLRTLPSVLRQVQFAQR
jgi:hypothetical protein